MPVLRPVPLRGLVSDVTLAAPRMSQNYKDTLNLPKTDFPMKASLTTREPQMLKHWEAAGLYQQIQNAREGADLFVLHDGPPSANGDGHTDAAVKQKQRARVGTTKNRDGM